MKALFFGSFDPFTIGHYSLLKQAEKLFDGDVIVAIVKNPKKPKRRFSIESCKRAIESITDCKVIYADDVLPIFIAADYGCEYIVRGLRNTNDYIYEEAIALSEAEINDWVKTIYLRTNNNISSTLVYELYKQGEDVKRFLPYGLERLQKNDETTF